MMAKELYLALSEAQIDASTRYASEYVARRLAKQPQLLFGSLATQVQHLERTLERLALQLSASACAGAFPQIVVTGSPPMLTLTDRRVSHGFLLHSILENIAPILDIRLEEVSERDGATIKCVEPIRMRGRWNSVRVSAPSRLKPLGQLIAAVASVVLATGYGVIEDRLDGALNREESFIARGLYGELERLFPERELRQNLWLAVVGPSRGFRLISPEQGMAAIDILNRYAKRTQRSGYEMAARLLDSRLPRKGLLMDRALAEGKPIVGDLAQAKYYQQTTEYAFVMQGLYNASSFEIWPIYRSSRRNVLLLFPTESPAIVARLQAYAAQLTAACESHLAEVDEAIDLFDRGRLWQTSALTRYLLRSDRKQVDE